MENLEQIIHEEIKAFLDEKKKKKRVQIAIKKKKNPLAKTFTA